MSTGAIHTGTETFIEQTDPDWRTFYVKWNNPDDPSEPGVSLEEVLQAIVDAQHPRSDPSNPSNPTPIEELEAFAALGVALESLRQISDRQAVEAHRTFEQLQDTHLSNSYSNSAPHIQEHYTVA